MAQCAVSHRAVFCIGISPSDTTFVYSRGTNGYDAHLRNPLKGFRQRYTARRQTAQAAHALGPKGRKLAGGVGRGPGTSGFRQVQRLVIQLDRLRATIVTRRTGER